MDGTCRHHAKGNKSDRERQIPYDFTYIGNLKKKKKPKEQTHTKRQKQTHRYREQMGDCQREGKGGWAK